MKKFGRIIALLIFFALALLLIFGLPEIMRRSRLGIGLSPRRMLALAARSRRLWERLLSGSPGMSLVRRAWKGLCVTFSSDLPEHEDGWNVF
jgi:hypothetical protein